MNTDPCDSTAWNALPSTATEPRRCREPHGHDGWHTDGTMAWDGHGHAGPVRP